MRRWRHERSYLGTNDAWRDSSASIRQGIAREGTQGGERAGIRFEWGSWPPPRSADERPRHNRGTQGKRGAAAPEQRAKLADRHRLLSRGCDGHGSPFLPVSVAAQGPAQARQEYRRARLEPG